MEVASLNESLEKISLAADQKKAILQIIDAKVSNDMREVIIEMKHIEARLESKIQMVHDKLSNEIKVMYWVMGISQAILLFFIARK